MMTTMMTTMMTMMVMMMTMMNVDDDDDDDDLIPRHVFDQRGAHVPQLHHTHRGQEQQGDPDHAAGHAHAREEVGSSRVVY